MVRNEIEGFIIKVQKYKENDAIINFFTSEGVKSIYGPSYKSIKSKYHVLNNLFLKVKIFGEEKKNLKVRDYEILDYPKFAIEDYDFLQRLFNISDLIIRTNEEHDQNQSQKIYNYFEEVYQKINKENYENIYYWFICKLLKVNYITPEFTKCIRCFRKNEFYGFLIEDGGIICKNCYNREDDFHLLITEIKEIKMINYLFNGKIEAIEKIKILPLIKRGINFLLNETLGIYNK